MSLPTEAFDVIPAETVRVAQAAFPHQTRFMQMRDTLGTIYNHPTLEALYPPRGKPAEAPWRLALITVMQCAANLSDRAAADAVHSRIDWKYALSLELTDPGFHYSVLAKFRTRLVAGQAETILLEALLERLQACRLLHAGGRARTDSTHVLAAVRTLNRLECMGETLRATLNALAVVAPDWLRQQITAEWFMRYSLRVEEGRLPESEAQRTAYAEQIGVDGLQLLQALYHATAPHWLRAVPTVETLRTTWLHQYYTDTQGQCRWRPAQEGPPASLRTASPYDGDAHRGQKGMLTWTGYKVHLTETCEDETFHVITHVETTSAPVADVTMTTPIHQALCEKKLAPTTHLVDAGYISSTVLVQSVHKYQIDLVGPVPKNVSWQAQNPQAYDITHFQIDWAAQRVTCPQGKMSRSWRPQHDKAGDPVINVQFAARDCGTCEVRARCTKARSAPRSMTLQPELEHRLLQTRRQEQATLAWQQRYDARAGIEGTLSQGIRAFGLRQCRYRGLPKTRLQHLAIAAALNIERLAAWLDERPHAKTRISQFAALAA